MIDTTDAGGQRLVVFSGCANRERATEYVHGTADLSLLWRHDSTSSSVATNEFPEGTCYYMPPNTPMAAANLGTEDVHLYDTFNLPPEAPTIAVSNPGGRIRTQTPAEQASPDRNIA